MNTTTELKIACIMDLLPMGSAERVPLLRSVELNVVHEGLGLLDLDAREAGHGLAREEPAKQGR